MATVEEIHASNARIQAKLDALSDLFLRHDQDEAARGHERNRELRELRDRIIKLEVRTDAERSADQRRVTDERWNTIETWLVRVGAAAGAVGFAADVVGII